MGSETGVARPPGQVVAAAVAGAAITPLMPAYGTWPVGLAALPVLAVVAFAGHRHHVPELVDAAAVVGLMDLIALAPVVGVWPLAPLLALVSVGAVLAMRRRLDRWRDWLRLGRVDRLSVLLVVAVQVVSVVALLTWTRMFDGALPALYADAAREAGPLAAGLGGFLFLVVNGLVEDSLFFGVLLSSLDRVLPGWLAVGLTAAAFGFAHLHGIPNGVVGVAMAGSWALLLAALRLRTGGMLATYAAHIVADTTIVLMLLPAVFR
ncbi:MAG: CPBP family intramembrane glutamic endopeptidase [Nocardioidaceae bacterium]